MRIRFGGSFPELPRALLGSGVSFLGCRLRIRFEGFLFWAAARVVRFRGPILSCRVRC